jgi:DNA invertase Pin-like site-specific DNA recombinase
MPATARRPGLSYTRFSDPKQADGDSDTRQAEDFRDFCSQHNLIPLREVYADRGRSGYHDEHRKKGRLGELIRSVQAGRIEKGTVIVIEAWDRLGRLRPDKQVKLVAELLELGVDIGVCRLNDIFTLEDFGSHKWTTLAIFVQLAHEESLQKAKRVARSWGSRRKRAREQGTPIAGRIPRWLELVHGRFRPVPEAVASIKAAFALAGEGRGLTRTISALRKAKVPPVGGKRWTRPYLRMILTDKRVLGEFQPRDRHGKPQGEAIENYYPAVVSPEEYNQARATLLVNAAAQPGKKGRQSRHVNVFRSLLVHGPDGEALHVRNKGTKESPKLVLINAAGYEGRGQSRSYPYLAFEEDILSLLEEVRPEDVLPAKDEGPGTANVLRARRDNLKADLEGLKADLRKAYSRTLSELVLEKEAELEGVLNDLQEELARSARPAEKAWPEVPGLMGLIRNSPDPDAARLKARAVLRAVVETIAVVIVTRGAWRLCAAQVWFPGGAHRDYLLMYRTAAGGRDELRQPPRDFRFEPGDAPLDLRRREHALEMEAALSNLALDDI